MSPAARGSLEEGARNVVEVCMDVRAGERVIVVSDRGTRDVGEAIAAAARARSDDVALVLLEELAERPLAEVPQRLETLLDDVDVSVWCAESVRGELPVRMAYRDLLPDDARHGHMPGVTRQLMETGMCADYEAIADLTNRLHARLQGVEEIHVEGVHGTELDATFDPSWHWIPDTGLLHEPGDWGNLPAGEVFTAPYAIEGHLVTPLLGDWFSDAYGPLDPLVELDIVGSRVDLDSIEGGPEGLVADLRAYLTTAEESDRAGEFAIGTNTALAEPVGNLLQDEKIPGVHVAFGNPYPDRTGAPWNAPTHIDAICPGVDVWLDGEQVMEKGVHRL